MPYPNGRPTVDELEAEAQKEIDAAATMVDEGDLAFAAVRASIGQVYATLAVCAQMDRLVDALPGAGRGA